MGYGIVKSEELSDIADAIRAKLGVQTQYKPGQMADAIESISGGGITPSGTKSITENGTYDVSEFASANVNVPQSGITPTGTKTVSVTANGTTTEDVTNYANVQINTNVVNQDYENALVALGVQSDLANSITALTTYANGVTGAADTDLSDAVHTLGSGYGQGGETDYDVATLPAEYQRVEYIQSSGTQYIQLPIGFTPTDEIHMMGAINNTTNSEKTLVCPATYNTDNNRFAICASNGSKFMCAYGNVSTSNSVMTANRNTSMHDWSYRNGVFISESTKSAYGVGNASFGTENPNVRLFYGFNAASAGKIRYYVHKKAGDTGVALYACYRKADGVIGLYDVDNDVFYTNAGTGTFTKGADL